MTNPNTAASKRAKTRALSHCPKSAKPSPTAPDSSKKSARAAKSSAKTRAKTRAASDDSPRLTRLKAMAVLIIALIIAGVLFFDIETVRSNAMNPALWRGDVVLSWNPKLFSAQLSPGDIALINTNDGNINDKKSDLKPNFLRCISAGSDEISFSQDALQINGVPVSRLELTNPAIIRPADVPDRWRETLPNGAQYEIILPQQRLTGDLSGNRQIASDTYFLVGDNRMASLDSRQNGDFRQNQIRGRALFVLYTTQDNGFIGHLFRIVR